MSIEIVVKPKTEPRSPQGHKSLVPLRVVQVERLDAQYGPPSSMVKPGDVLVVIPSGWGGTHILNATQQKMVDTKYADNITCLRAYDVQSVYIANDNEPAPV